MSLKQPIETRHYTAPLVEPIARDLIALLEHKGAPWIGDIRQRVRGQLTDVEDHYFVALNQDRMVGHVWYTTSASDPRWGVIGHVFTHPDARRHGISKRLLELALTEFDNRGGAMMQLFTSTPFIIPLYEQLGFESLFTHSAFHDQDWYMRRPTGSDEQLDRWFDTAHISFRSLASGDLPRYCLLYNATHNVLLKDRAQRVGFGLEAELAFIGSLQAIRQQRATCSVLDNGQAIVGAASLFGAEFPHQSHIGMFDIHTCPQATHYTTQLADHCLRTRRDIGVEKIYAISVDPSKQELLPQLGFTRRATLPDHYRVAQSDYDCELFELTE